MQRWAQPILLPGANVEAVTVSPGDFVLGDIDGVVVIPAEHVLQVLERSEAVTERERDIRVALQQGMSLQDAIATFGSI